MSPCRLDTHRSFAARRSAGDHSTQRSLKLPLATQVALTGSLRSTAPRSCQNTALLPLACAGRRSSRCLCALDRARVIRNARACRRTPRHVLHGVVDASPEQPVLLVVLTPVAVHVANRSRPAIVIEVRDGEDQRPNIVPDRRACARHPLGCVNSVHDTCTARRRGRTRLRAGFACRV